MTEQRWRVEQDLRPWDTLEEACNLLYYGTPQRPEGFGREGVFRAVCVVGCVLAAPSKTGNLQPLAFSSYNGSIEFPEAGLELVAQLRRCADEIEARIKG